jgi:signal transduction histidine kinase/DNA-binding response OmpR family regulator/HAMP domain-containing protein
MVLIALFVARSFSKPIHDLKEGIATIGKGNLDYKVGTQSKDEIGQLSRAFDEMIGSLKKATASRAEFEIEVAERKLAEEAMAAKNREIASRNRYESSYSKVVSLFSETFDQHEMLSSTLDLMAAHHPFPVSAIYLYDEWSGQLNLAADHGVPKHLQQTYHLGEGVVGQVIRDGKPVFLDEMDSARVLPIDTGLVSFAPAAVIAAPIHFQEKPLAVLILASSKPLLDMDKALILRLTKQLGVALNNLTQHQALSDLAAQLKVNSKEIKEKNTQLEVASRMKSEFLANMSHELRTPLNAIIGFSEVLKDGILGELDDEQVEYVTDIYSSGRHLLSLINDILDLSKIEAGKMELDIEPVDVANMLRNSTSIIKEKAASNHIQLDCNCDGELNACYMDGRKVKQVIYNLLSNAIKFTPDGGRVVIRAARVSGAELIRNVRENQLTPMGKLNPDSEYLEVTVSDTGIGISDEDKERLFKPFQQLESTLTKTYEGTGLGLVMVKRLIELHGGTVGLESCPGKGSTFVFWVPFFESKKQALVFESKMKHEVEQHQAVHSHNQLVLIVEDDEDSAKLMRLQLEETGYRTLHAISAEQALDMLENETPDLITLDIMLPGMDGWDFLAELQKRKDMAHIPVVVVSMADHTNRSFSFGAAAVLQKPVSREMLLNVINKMGCSMQGKNVLVADDDPKAVELVSRHLNTIGCFVLKAHGGQEAIDMAQEKIPDLIILDLMMPEVSGFDVVDTLKKDSVLSKVPIMILTAKVITEEDRKHLNGDIVRIVEKRDFGHSDFIDAIRCAMGNK